MKNVTDSGSTASERIKQQLK